MFFGRIEVDEEEGDEKKGQTDPKGDAHAVVIIKNAEEDGNEKGVRKFTIGA